MSPPSMTGKPLIGTEVFTWREGPLWVAAWRRFDLIAQGKTEQEAVRSLIRTIAGQAMADAELGNLKSFGSCKATTPALVRRWARQHQRTHMN